MSYYWLLFFVRNPSLVLCVDSAPGHAVPHADILDEILSAHITNNSIYDPQSLTDLLVGTATKPFDPQNLALNILDVESVRRIINSTRRQNILMTEEYKDTMAYRNNNVIVKTATNLMLQSLYFTRFRLRSTKAVREKFADDASFKIGVLYAAARQIVQKMEHLYSQLTHIPYGAHFIWFLILYEKLLAYNVDVSDSVEKIFDIHAAFVKKYGDTHSQNPQAPKDKENDLSFLLEMLSSSTTTLGPGLDAGRK